jgi:hypothetical protein
MTNFERRNASNKAAIICKLHELADFYLLGPGTWPARRESLATFSKAVREMGLDEDVPDSSPGTTRCTDLGKDLNLHLFMAFVGAWDLCEVPWILETNGYLEETETDAIEWISPQILERVIRGYVLRAYFKFCNRSEHVN